MNNQEATELITELETKIAFLEAANDDLERALLSQHERIDRLDVIVNELRNRIKEQASVIEGLESVSSEPPPPLGRLAIADLQAPARYARVGRRPAQSR